MQPPELCRWVCFGKLPWTGPSAGQLTWPRPQMCPCLTRPCETRSSQCAAGLGTKMVQLVRHQLLMCPTFPPSLTQPLFISSRSFTQAEAAGLILATGTGQCCQSRLTETWTAAGQHNRSKENKCNIVPAGLYSWEYPLSQTTCFPKVTPKVCAPIPSSPLSILSFQLNSTKVCVSNGL